MSKLASAWFLLCGAISSPLSAQVADAVSPDANLIRLTSLTTGTGKVTGAPVPFGGMKQSGLAREGARYGLEAFTDIKYVCRDWA